MHKLRTRIILSHVVLSMVIVALISILVNVVFDKVFREYVISNQHQKSMEIVTQVTERYNDFNAGWNYEILDQIGMVALGNGLITKVKDGKGNILWNAWEHNEGNCASMLKTMAENMYSVYPNFKGGYVEESIDIIVKGERVGFLDIGYYGPFYYTENEINFIKTFNSMLMWVGISSLVIAIILGLFISQGLTKPIIKVIRAAGQITKGNFSERVLVKSKTVELNDLASTINNLAETLETLESLRKRLTGDIAHEFRTPLFTLQSHVEAMIDGVWEADTERLQSCHDEIMRLNRMVGDLKKLSSFESESLTLDKQSFNLNELVERTVLNFQAECVKREIQLVLENKYTGQIHADKDKFSQILVNIISNALRYTDKGGNIHITTERKEDTAVITIKDTGIGIANEDLPFIFERFYRTDKSRTKATGGSGIGLTIAKALILAHDGDISVESELGCGTTIVVSLPVSGHQE